MSNSRGSFRLSTKKQAVLDALLRSEGNGKKPPKILKRVSPTSPLSYAQRRLWFLDQLEPGKTAYVIGVTLRLQGELQVAALAAAVRELVQRHEVLRTRFVAQGGEPVQVVAAEWSGGLQYVDLSASADGEAQAQEWIGAERARPFDLSTGPLLRVGVLRLGAEIHLLSLTVHNIVGDGWSLEEF